MRINSIIVCCIKIYCSVNTLTAQLQAKSNVEENVRGLPHAEMAPEEGTTGRETLAVDGSEPQQEVHMKELDTTREENFDSTRTTLIGNEADSVQREMDQRAFEATAQSLPTSAQSEELGLQLNIALRELEKAQEEKDDLEEQLELLSTTMKNEVGMKHCFSTDNVVFIYWSKVS